MLLQQHVQAIRRRQHLSRPNALEIKYTSGSGHKYEVLANLEDREGVFFSLLELWDAVKYVLDFLQKCQWAHHQCADATAPRLASFTATTFTCSKHGVRRS